MKESHALRHAVGSNGSMYQKNHRMEIKASEVVVLHIPLPSVDKKAFQQGNATFLVCYFFHVKTRQLEN